MNDANHTQGGESGTVTGYCASAMDAAVAAGQSPLSVQRDAGTGNWSPTS